MKGILQEIMKKNKIEGTPILKLATVKSLKVNKNLQKKIVKNSSPKIRHQKFVIKNSSPKITSQKLLHTLRKNTKKHRFPKEKVQNRKIRTILGKWTKRTKNNTNLGS